MSGLTDVDAITLSSVRLYALENLQPNSVVTAIALAVLSNLAFKLALAVIVGGTPLGRKTMPAMLTIAIGIGAGLAVLWV